MKKKFIMTILIGLSIVGFSSAAYAQDSAQNVNVDFEHSDSIQLTMSSNIVSFGKVSGLVKEDATTPQDLIATIKSSQPYNLKVKATSNFTNSNGDQIDSSKLEVGADSNFKRLSGQIDSILVNNAQRTKGLVNDQASYVINFKLDPVIGETGGKFTMPITFTAAQI